METNTVDVSDAYQYWSGTKPSAEIHVEKAQYWQSAHFTKEYILYLKLKPDAEWWKKFIQQNALEIKDAMWTDAEDTPDWFKPSTHSIQHGTKGFFDQGSRYFRDTLTGECYIYEIQL